MQADFFARLTSAISPSRLAPYQRHPSDDLRTVFGRYRWNWALTSALQAPFAAFEVAFRNRLHTVLSEHCKHDAWFDDLPLKARSRAAIDEVKARLQRRRKPCAPDDVVAALSLGFWCSLFDRDYEQILFPRPLVHALSGLPRKDRTRSFISRRLCVLSELRNRVSHHEPIWNNPVLAQRHDELLETLLWFSKESAVLLPISKEHDFWIVFRRGPATYEPGGAPP